MQQVLLDRFRTICYNQNEVIYMNEQAARIMAERFGRDCVIALATVGGGEPFVRYVNAYYEDGSFYVITHGLSRKMRQLRERPSAAIAGEWFTRRAAAHDEGWFGDEKYAALAAKLRRVFAQWIDNGHNDFSDRNTIILRPELTSGVLMSHGTRYDIADFASQ